MKNRKITRWGALLGVAVCACALFLLCYRYDNKYTQRPHPAGQGITVLDRARYEQRPFLYLIHGWELYENRLLSPGEIADGATPDRYLYLGEYGGFDLGDADAAPHGRGTYRMTVFTGGEAQEYALELTQIYSAWRLWVNGTLVQCVGMEPPKGTALPRPGSDRAVFRAGDRVELVVEVEDAGSFYSGMVYPPAFGSPQAVGKMLLLRLLLHGGLCIAALLAGVFSLLVGIGYRFSQPFGGLFALCVCFCAATSYPVYLALGWNGALWFRLELLGAYGMLAAAVWTQGRLIGLPKRVYGVACALGIAICGGILLRLGMPAERAGELYWFSGLLAGYKWLAAAYLLAVGGWAVARGVRRSGMLVSGFLVFACALIMDRLLPAHEPILMGWYVEWAGAVQLGTMASALWADSVRVRRESMRLQEEKQLFQLMMDARKEHALLQQEYVGRTREQLHETRNHLAVLRHYASAGNRQKALDYIDRLLEDTGKPQIVYTGHELIDAILGVQFSRAQDLGIHVSHETESLPPELGVEDGDIATLLMNLLDNAVESCERLASEEGWLRLQICMEGEELFVECLNASCIHAKRDAPTAKADPRAHGFGLKIMEETAKKYGGYLELEDDGGSFMTVIHLHPRREPRPAEMR